MNDYQQARQKTLAILRDLHDAKTHDIQNNYDPYEYNLAPFPDEQEQPNGCGCLLCIILIIISILSILTIAL